MAELDRYDRGKAISRDSLISVKAFLESVTVVLLCFKNGEEVSDLVEICSGTLVKHDGRHFVATCGHAIRKYEVNKIAISYSKTKFERQPFIFPFKSMLYLEDEHFDLGWLEVDIKQLNSFDKSFLDSSRISKTTNVNDDSFIVTGFPSELISKELLQKKTAQVQQVIYATVNSKKRMHEVDFEFHILMVYHLNGQVQWNFEGKPMPQPHGLSGGGIWNLNIIEEKGIWSHEKCELVGIEYQWWKESALVHGNHAKYWIDNFPF